LKKTECNSLKEFYCKKIRENVLVIPLKNYILFGLPCVLLSMITSPHSLGGSGIKKIKTLTAPPCLGEALRRGALQNFMRGRHTMVEAGDFFNGWRTGKIFAESREQASWPSRNNFRVACTIQKNLCLPTFTTKKYPGPHSRNINTFICDERKFRHENMQSKFLILVLVVAFLLIPAVLAEDTAEWNTYGQAALLAGNYAGALTYFDNALAQNANYAPALTGKAIAFNALGQYDSALIAANQSLSFISKNQDTQNAKAYALLGLGRYNESIDEYNTLFTVPWNHADAYCNQGAAYMMINDSSDAVGSYVQCTSLDPTNIMSWDSLGRAYAGEGNYPLALSAYTQGTSIKVKNATLWDDKGKVLLLMGRTSDALQSFDRALGIDPNFADARANHDLLYGTLQVVNITGTVTPTVTISRLGTFYTTPIPAEPVVSVSEITSAPASEPASEGSPVPVTSTVSMKPTYSPLSPLSVLGATIAAGAIVMLTKRRNT
jgi:tetratricopeptide (TPR) repeat protein